MSQTLFNFARGTETAHKVWFPHEQTLLSLGGNTSHESGAVLSADERYRYLLWRRWGHARPTALWCLVNPSTADHAKDDPTIRRIRSFTQRMGLDAFAVVNLFAWRATDIGEMWDAEKRGEHIVGPDNDAWLAMAANDPDVTRIVLAWGGDGALRPLRSRAVAERLYDAAATSIPPRPCECLGFTKAGTKNPPQPKHPVRLAGATPFEAFPDPRVPFTGAVTP